MSRDINRVFVSGHLGKDVELRITPNGRSVATFSVASGRQRRGDDGNTINDTEWFRVVAWEKLAETCSTYLHKGSHVFIEGRIQTREWQDNTGAKRFSTEVIATDMTMLDTKRQDNGEGEGYEEEAQAAAPQARQTSYNGQQGQPRASTQQNYNQPSQRSGNAPQTSYQKDQADLFGDIDTDPPIEAAPRPQAPRQAAPAPQGQRPAQAQQTQNRPAPRQQAPAAVLEPEVEPEDIPF